MKAAKIYNSDRLQRVRDFLKDGKQHSTLDIVKNAKVCAVNSIVSELRVNGFDIVCRRKGHAWYYRMIA